MAVTPVLAALKRPAALPRSPVLAAVAPVAAAPAPAPAAPAPVPVAPAAVEARPVAPEAAEATDPAPNRPFSPPIAEPTPEAIFPPTALSPALVEPNRPPAPLAKDPKVVTALLARLAALPIDFVRSPPNPVSLVKPEPRRLITPLKPDDKNEKSPPSLPRRLSKIFPCLYFRFKSASAPCLVRERFSSSRRS